MVAGDQATAGVLLLSLGLYYALVHGPLTRRIPAASVFLLWFTLAYLLCLKIYKPSIQNTKRRVLYVVLSMLVSIELTILTKFVLQSRAVRKLADSLWHSICRSVLGMLSGIAFACYLFGMANNGLLESSVKKAMFVLCFALAGLLFKEWAVGFLGSYLVALGIDCFWRTGYIAHMAQLADLLPLMGTVSYRTGQDVMCLQALVLVLAAAGAALRWWLMVRRLKAKLSDDLFALETIE
ncbi:hypothetical protein GGI25_001679 [Coemansia spiralis]|uniref:TM7S3/TM198-like domain-containing protein n=2 Tax=Coemansia TaxID=4863 RepID=A0A9W8KYA7_9FUNG|nr:hypothetical protein BX070DRAFT_265358 [Coemansia spiralis]KAJ1989309.1 hypothetical protein EDC05_004759 [Coemansia umbellata]KAJ2623890.1 hypothetical protein GGI26_001904 [Coemansia sp. RSA 1358]KAJ2679322.1 hypothetical protein GGI25_001679 [Coemansia spiralis]